MMVRKSLVLALTGALCGVAAAQPVDQPGTTDVAPTPAPPPPAPTPPPAPEPAPPPPPPRPAPTFVHEAPPEVATDRPTDVAFAIGLGYTRPPGGSLDLETPNIASARIRLISGLTFEPTVTIANTSINTDPGTPGSMSTTNTITELGLGTLVRWPVIRHRKVDFEVIGSLGFDVSKSDPTGDYNTTTLSDVSLGWGIGIGYWLSRHWQVSATATNPILTFTKTSTETGVQDVTMSTSQTTFGVTFDPTISFMIHLYN